MYRHGGNVLSHFYHQMWKTVMEMSVIKLYSNVSQFKNRSSFFYKHCSFGSSWTVLCSVSKRVSNLLLCTLLWRHFGSFAVELTAQLTSVWSKTRLFLESIDRVKNAASFCSFISWSSKFWAFFVESFESFVFFSSSVLNMFESYQCVLSKVRCAIHHNIYYCDIWFLLYIWKLVNLIKLSADFHTSWLHLFVHSRTQNLGPYCATCSGSHYKPVENKSRLDTAHF